MSQVDAIANAVLYEGYLLYPYRRSAVKNQVRWTFGSVHPRDWSEATGGGEPWLQQTQCLVTAAGGGGRFPAGCRLEVTVRFLRLLACTRPGELDWQEATEHRVSAPGLDMASLLSAPVTLPIELPKGEPPTAADGVGRRFERIWAEAEIGAERVEQQPVGFTLAAS